MKEIDTVLVFAGDYRQFKNWCNKTFHTDTIPVYENFVYVSSYEKSLGYHDVMVIKVGTWYEHEWIRKAIARLENMNKHLVSLK